jgi:hypothetical protein
MDGVDGRRRRRSGTRGSAATNVGRRRRGEAADSRSMRRRKRGERCRLGVKTRRRGTLTRAEAVKATAAWHAQTHAVRTGAAAGLDIAVGRHVRRGKASGRAVEAPRLGHGCGTVRTAPLRHGTGAWQSRGYGLLTSGPGADRWDPAAAIF